jgi:putative RecB family exonuclease
MSEGKAKQPPFTPPEYLSPSSINTFGQCPLKFKFSKIDGLHDPSGKEALLGNFVHDILEDLYRYPSELRTQALAKELAREQWQSKWEEQVTALISSPKELNFFRWTAWWCVENLWKLENPTDVVTRGMETFVRGEIAGVKIHGYIDRLTLREGRIAVTDYKTGKTPRSAFLDDKFFQLIVYALLIGTLSIDKEGVSSDELDVELLYLKDGVRFLRTVSPDDVAKTELAIQETKADIDKACKTGDFEFRPSILCNWCGFKSMCPAWN